ncbi:MAG: hypothetical protein QXK37_05555 [Candidatus Woesearchaeota archaeon]
MEQLTSNPYIVPECAYAVDANTLFERCPSLSNDLSFYVSLFIAYYS